MLLCDEFLYGTTGLKKIRLQLGLTQKQLADMAGVSQSLIAKIESNKIDPSHSKVLDIYTALRKRELELQRKKKEITVGDICNRDLRMLSPDDTIEKAMKIMKEGGFSQIPIYDGKNVVGIVTDRMLFIYYDGPRNRPLREVMGPPPIMVPETTSIEVIKPLLPQEYAIIVIKDGRPYGILTPHDFF